MYIHIVAQGPKPCKVFFSEPVLFYFYIIPANVHILLNACSSTQIRNGVRSNKVKHVCRMSTDFVRKTL